MEHTVHSNLFNPLKPHSSLQVETTECDVRKMQPQQQEMQHELDNEMHLELDDLSGTMQHIPPSVTTPLDDSDLIIFAIHKSFVRIAMHWIEFSRNPLDIAVQSVTQSTP
eukprot:274671_1